VVIDNVAAAVRNKDSLKELLAQFPENSLVIPSDVTNKKTSFEAAAKVKSHFGVYQNKILNCIMKTVDKSSIQQFVSHLPPFV
jgi:NADP-dependent 3-hydroxy acid dehydrogenase YdfG